MGSAFRNVIVSSGVALALLAPVHAGDWTNDPYLIRKDEELLRCPMPGYMALLRRITPDRVGTLVQLAPADCRFVPRRRDDVSDLISAQRERFGPDAPPVPGDPEEISLRQFQLYLDGRLLHERGDQAAAVCRWNEVLEQPAEGRRWRSTRAAYMIGRSVQHSDPELAAKWYRAVRSLAAEGCADTLGLACASIGWEARAELDLGRIPRALALYLEQHAAGDPTADESILFACRRGLDEATLDLSQLAVDPVSRRIFTVWVLGAWGCYDFAPEGGMAGLAGRWCGALEDSGVVQPGLPEVDLLAAMAYECEDLERAREWSAMAPADAPVARWVRVKLACREGGLEDAIAAMRDFASSDGIEFEESIPPQRPHSAWSPAVHDDGHGPMRSRALCELGALLVSAGRFEEAFGAFVAGRSREDAAYLLERILSADRAAELVDGCFPDPAVAMGPLSPATWQPSWRWGNSVGEGFRHLVGARFLRELRVSDARAFVDSKERAKLDLLARLLATGDDSARRDGERAAALWDAAQLVRHECADIAATTSELGGYRAYWEYGRLAMPTADEMVRWESSATVPTHVRHMRYRAAELAWRASLLLPDEDPFTAEVLCEAGRWLAPHDPKSADRFYKSLVRRCGSTALGAEADRRRWFPPRT
ncbi:MAG: hypothetical protein FJ260_10930 [Planctomycetes bacterium]|nr:hypothetical protein [Planctomycetota bacterium]